MSRGPSLPACGTGGVLWRPPFPEAMPTGEADAAEPDELLAIRAVNVVPSAPGAGGEGRRGGLARRSTGVPGTIGLLVMARRACRRLVAGAGPLRPRTDAGMPYRAGASERPAAS